MPVVIGFAATGVPYGTCTAQLATGSGWACVPAAAGTASASRKSDSIYFINYLSNIQITARLVYIE
jgi:tetrahydromethanopterin S-methyltransferase subunit D